MIPTQHCGSSAGSGGRPAHPPCTTKRAVNFALQSLLIAAAFISLNRQSIAAPDTLVVCPAEFQTALDEWITYRRGQGHEIQVIQPHRTANELREAIRHTAAGGELKCLVLVGDVPGAQAFRAQGELTAVPTNHVDAKVNTRWGSTPTIATDVPFADTDEDGLPDLTIGRMPARSPDELTQAIRKIIRYEQENQDGAWQRRLDIVAGIGGFGVLADSLIEAAGRQVFQQAVPTGYELRHASAKTANIHSNEFRETVARNLNEGSLAWIYMGHGMPTELDRVPTSSGHQPILSTADIANVRCEQCRPLAVLVACYTGAFDAKSACLAEELCLAKEGPVAVIAATRVTMPYGNTVFGYELMRACFGDQPTSLGESIRLAQRRTMAPVESDTFRPSLDSLAQGLSPPPVDLAGERREHVLMYHLFGDPLLRLRIAPSDGPLPATKLATPLIGTAIGK